MQKNKLIQKNYSNNCSVYQLIFPLDTGILIPEDDSVRLLSQVMEELDYTVLIKAYSTQGRNSAVPPHILFKILVYAYMNNIYSSRKIEKACRRDINFIWLLQGRKAPDHNTIARFRKKGLLKLLIICLINLLKNSESSKRLSIKIYSLMELKLNQMLINIVLFGKSLLINLNLNYKTKLRK